MNLKNTLGAVVSLSLGTGILQAQLSEVDFREDFSTESVEFDFEGPSDQAPAGDLFSRWGLRFSDGSSGVPEIIQRPVLLPLTDNALINISGSGPRPLVIDLKYPARRIGFDLGNGDENTEVLVTAFNAVGDSLGSVQRSGVDPHFLGVGVPGGDGISKLNLSYENSSDPEEIDNLIVEYVDRPDFETFLAQVADGPIQGLGTFQTTIVVSNSSNSTATGEVLLFDSSGIPLNLDFGSGPVNSVSLEIPPRSSRTLVSSGTADPVGVGYARVQTNVPANGTAIFRLTSPSGAIDSEAGVGSDIGRVDVVGAVEKRAAAGFDSGIAVVNPTNLEADADVLLLDQSGEPVALNKGVLDLQPRTHIARFLSDMFSELEGEDFSGTIQITSSVPLVVVLMRTINGVVISSLPVGSTQQ